MTPLEETHSLETVLPTIAEVAKNESDPDNPVANEARTIQPSLERKRHIRDIEAIANKYLDAADVLYQSKNFLLSKDGEGNPRFVQVQIDREGAETFSVEMPVVEALTYTDQNQYAVSPDGTVFLVTQDKAANTISISTICLPLEGNLSLRVRGQEHPLFKGAVDPQTRQPGKITTIDHGVAPLPDATGSISLGMVLLKDADLAIVESNLKAGLARVKPKQPQG